MSDEAVIGTRRGWHALAEHVLSAARHAATGRIGLRPTPGGFGTPPFDSRHGARQVRVEGVDLVVIDDRGERRTPITTLAEAAAFAEVAPGAPAVYTPSTALDLHAPLAVDPGAAAVLAGFFARTAEALDRLVGERAADHPAEVQLWPEHFDLATTIAEVNYGGSPGDDEHPTPYLYVGPWNPPEPDGAFWNEPFGASVTDDGTRTVEEILAFFREGYERLH